MPLNPLFTEILQAHGLPQGQSFNEAEANRVFPKGCTCPDDSGSCDWCSVYYGQPCKECAKGEECDEAQRLWAAATAIYTRIGWKGGDYARARAAYQQHTRR